ncbi:hypothetical protein GCM10009527_062960 [Actinomadura nitritigenes]|uniref:Uncharacterized protein n=1 Tax=Actinomadura nitritigenes TaxID=134602 RepID=A0ABS3RCI0_9ACTN|nr:hypothetical protein [Actinomadura nitritigenes]MBO2443939.1 hypothetical protein [Actinomadura nitritigenes]
MSREHRDEVRRPSTGRQTLLVWIAVLPTLTAVQVALGAVLEGLPAIVRPMIVATVVVPIVMLLVMPRLLRLNERFGARRPAPNKPEPDSTPGAA